MTSATAQQTTLFPNEPELSSSGVKPHCMRFHMAAAAKKKYVITGYLNKEKSSELFSLLGSWNKRYFTFDGTILNYYQDADGINFMGPSGSIHIKEIKGVKALMEVPGYIFQLFTFSRTYKLQAFNETDRSRWVIAIQNSINARDARIEAMRSNNGVPAKPNTAAQAENEAYARQLAAELGVPKPKKAAASRVVEDEAEPEEEEPEEEEPPKPVKKVVKKVVKKPVVVEDDEADEDAIYAQNQADLEEEPEVPKTKKVVKKIIKKVVKKPVEPEPEVDEEPEEEPEEDQPRPKKIVKKIIKKVVKKPIEPVEDDEQVDEVDEQPVAAPVKKTVKKSAVDPFDFDLLSSSMPSTSTQSAKPKKVASIDPFDFTVGPAVPAPKTPDVLFDVFAAGASSKPAPVVVDDEPALDDEPVEEEEVKPKKKIVKKIIKVVRKKVPVAEAEPELDEEAEPEVAPVIRVVSRGPAKAAPIEEPAEEDEPDEVVQPKKVIVKKVIKKVVKKVKKPAAEEEDEEPDAGVL